jgi:ureidoglycolate hydrolase
VDYLYLSDKILTAAKVPYSNLKTQSLLSKSHAIMMTSAQGIKPRYSRNLSHHFLFVLIYREYIFLLTRYDASSIDSVSKDAEYKVD